MEKKIKVFKMKENEHCRKYRNSEKKEVQLQ